MTTDAEVPCRDLSGALHRVRLSDGGACSSPGSVLSQRLVTGPHEVPFLRKSVPVEAGRRDPRLYDLLDNEIRTLAHLTRVYGGRAAEVPVLAGYNVDVEEPFVLLRPYAGRPAADVVRALDEDRRRQFQISLLRALQVIGQAGVVHGELSPRTLRWDGSSVQLVDFESARPAGEPRRPGGGPYHSPERLAGGGPADPRDDVWSAGVLIRELVLGPRALLAPADQSGDPERLRQRLADVFQPVAQRPGPAELLRRMRVAAPDPRPADPRAGLAEGHRMFDEACRRKGGPPPDRPPAAVNPVDSRRRGLKRLFAAKAGPR